MKKYDVVISLFHVMSYQNNNEKILKAFSTAKKHLKANGIFIFDFTSHRTQCSPALLLTFFTI